MNGESPPLAAPLARRLSREAGARELGAVLVAVCREIDAELSRIIGPRGVAALHDRSLRLCAAAHSWLAAAATTDSAIDFAALESAVASQPVAEAARGASAYLECFHQLLASLVGLSLTEQLLRPVWPDSPAGGDTPKDDRHAQQSDD